MRGTTILWQLLAFFPLLIASTIVAVPASQDGLVFDESFDQINNRKFIIPRLPSQAIPFRGTLSGSGKSVATPSGRGIKLTGNSHIVYRAPKMIDPREGTLEVRLALDFQPGTERRKNTVFVNVHVKDEKRRVMARLYMSPASRKLVFGIYDYGERVWIATLAHRVNWQAHEWHDVKITWKHKMCMFIDGSLVSAIEADGLFTERFHAAELDLGKGELYIGPNRQNLLTDFTIDSMRIYSQQRKFIGLPTGRKRALVGLQPHLTVASTAVAPTIDGTIKPQEWTLAAATTGFVNLADGEVATQQTVVYITFDDRHLYIAMRMAGNPAKATRVPRDGKIEQSDHFELYLAPPWMKPGQYYYFAGNHHGSMVDGVRRNAAKPLDRSWDGDWQFANDVSEGAWIAEVAIPLKNLEVEQAEGDWRMDFRRMSSTPSTWLLARDGNDDYLPLGGVVRLGNEGAVSHIEAIEGLTTGQLLIKGSVRNPGTKPSKVVITATLQPIELLLGSTEPFLTTAVKTVSKDVQLPPNAVVPFELSERFADQKLDLLDLHIADDKRPMAQQAIPFHPAERSSVEVIPVASEDRVIIELDLRQLRQWQHVDVHGEVLSASGENVAQMHWQQLATGTTHVKEAPVTAWPIGEHTLHFSFRPAGSDRIVKQERLMYERRNVPKWYQIGQTLGQHSTVLAPWTPLERSGNELGMWGRRYVLGSEFLLSQIVSRDEPILAASMDLLAQIDGSQARVRLSKREVQTVEPHEIRWTELGKLGSLSYRADCLLEYDGMLKVDLTFMPSANTQVEQLVLRIPMLPQSSEYVHHSTSHYDAAFSGYLPKRGLRVPFKPYLWVGSLKRGLMWFAEGPINWHVAGDAMYVRRERDANTIEIHFINRRTILRQPLQLTFGLQATPVKQMPPGWRGIVLAGRLQELGTLTNLEERIGPSSWHMHERQQSQRQKPGQKLAAAAADDALVGHTTPLQLNTGSIAPIVNTYRARGTKTVIYQYLAGANPGRTTDFDRYEATWRNEPAKQLNFGEHGTIIGCSLSSSFQDFLLYGVNHLVDNAGIDGVYWDGGGGPPKSMNVLHHLGWIDASGQRQPHYPIFAARQFNKRLATLLTEKKGPEQYVIWNHISRCYDLPALSFSTAILDGESPFQAVREGGPKLTELVSLDYLRVQATGEHFGIVPTWLVYRRQGDPSVLRATLAMLLPHGTPLYPSGGVATSAPDAELMVKVWQAFHNFGVRDAAFVGYWENDDLLTLKPTNEKLICSLYQRDGRYLLLLSNIGKQHITANISLGKSARSQLQDKIAQDALDDTPLQIEKGTITVEVAPEDFRLIVVR